MHRKERPLIRCIAFDNDRCSGIIRQTALHDMDAHLSADLSDDFVRASDHAVL
jgi:hypothetical protein